MKERVAVIGVGQTKHQATRGDVSMAGLVREAADRALEDADLGWNDMGFDWTIADHFGIPE